MNNPYEFMEPAIKELARREAQAIVQAQLGNHTDTQKADRFVSEHASWLYQYDQNGQKQFQSVYDPMSGGMRAMPVMSQWGQIFGQEVQRISQQQARRGYSDIEEQKALAMREVQFQYLLAQSQQQRQSVTSQGSPSQAPGGHPVQNQQRQLSPQEQANQQFLRDNNPPAQMPPSQGRQRGVKDPVTRKNLKEKMLADLAANGINDQVLDNSLRSAGRQ
jgi:hypothetical protein